MPGQYAERGVLGERGVGGGQLEDDSAIDRRGDRNIAPGEGQGRVAGEALRLQQPNREEHITCGDRLAVVPGLVGLEGEGEDGAVGRDLPALGAVFHQHRQAAARRLRA